MQKKNVLTTKKLTQIRTWQVIYRNTFSKIIGIMLCGLTQLTYKNHHRILNKHFGISSIKITKVRVMLGLLWIKIFLEVEPFFFIFISFFGSLALYDCEN